MPVTEQHGFFALRQRLTELFTKVDPAVVPTVAIDKVLAPEGSLEAMRKLVNNLEARVVELETRRPF